MFDIVRYSYMTGAWGPLWQGDFPRGAFTFFVISDALNFSKGITTTHYDKPPLQKSITVPTEFANLTVTERQKRLLPYINFYVTQNLQPQRDDYYVTEDHYPITDANKEEVRPSSQNKFSELLQTTYQPTQVYQTETSQQAKTKFTPFLDTNALPGPFTPMIPQLTKVKVTYTPVDHKENVPNYSAIYDKLPQIKMQHSIIESPSAYDTPKTVIQFFQRKPHVRYIPVPELHEPRTHPKTYVHTYTPTSIDLPIQEHNYHQQINNQNHLIHQNINKPLIAKATPQPIRIIQLHNPKHNLVTPNMQRKPKPTYVPLLTVNPQNQFIVQEQKQYHNQNHKQYLQEVIPSSKPLVLFTQKEYPSLLSHNEIKQTKPYVLLQPSNTYTTESSTNYQHAPSLHLENSVTDIPIQNQEDPNSLNTILKKLQGSNALPHTLTEDNIDNSIKTLINILHSFKKGQRFSGPIVVEDLNEEHATGTASDSPGSVTQMFPANTPEGGTPGRPGIDYPALSRIPQTNFDCQTQRYKGFFADPDTNCQVWHYCDLNGGQASFLCPNGTIFSQVALTCDWWFNVKCSTTTQLYVLNERLYKYIIPLKPKFPEDYAGPLVDRYLALKFQEMEEKLKKEKKEKEKDKSEEIDELQLLEDQNQVSTSHTPEPQNSHK